MHIFADVHVQRRVRSPPLYCVIGHTSKQLLAAKDGKVTLLELDFPGLATLVKPGSKCKLVIILLGTNDLCQKLGSAGIVADITGLHRVAHEAGVNTVCVGIPPFNTRPPDATFELERIEVNRRLEAWAKGTQTAQASAEMAGAGVGSGKATFLPFPVEHGEGTAAEGWAADGVHMNRKGYGMLGARLAPVVRHLLGLGLGSTPGGGSSDAGGDGGGGGGGGGAATVPLLDGLLRQRSDTEC